MTQSYIDKINKYIYKKEYKHISVDLTKGTFGHFSSFCVIKFQKRPYFQDFACSYNRVKLLLTCNTIKGANSSDKIK